MRGKFHFTRWGIICLAVVVALGTVGVTYAGMKGPKGPKVKHDPIPIAYCSDPFTWVVSNDDGSTDNISPYGIIDPGDDGLDPSENQTAGQPCDDRYDKDVAKTEATKIDDYNIQVTVTNAYPCYYPTIFYGIINDGNIPGKIEGIVVDEDFHPNEEDDIADDITALDVTVGGISAGQTIAVGEEVMGNLAIHVEQAAEQNHVYTIRVRIETSVAYCGPCKGKVTQLTLQYNGSGGDAYIVVEQKKNGTVFEDWVTPGDTFTFDGKDKNGTLGTEISIYVDGHLNTKIHTSCSRPIGPGLVSGDFEVIEGYSKDGGLLCPIPPIPECGECEGGVTSLTLKYNGENKAAIAVKAGKDVVFGPQTVQPGEVFDFSGTRKGGTLGKEIEIWVDDELAVKIHTSCSQPIGPGLVVGDFEVVAGESRRGGKLCPIPIP